MSYTSILMRVNKRHSESLLRKLVEDSQERINQRRFCGELRTSLSVSVDVDYRNVSHRITKLEYDEELKAIVAEFIILETYSGNLAKQLYELNAIDLKPRLLQEANTDDIKHAILISCDLCTLTPEEVKLRQRQRRLRAIKKREENL